MTRNQIWGLLASAKPYMKTVKHKIALFTFALILAMFPVESGTDHVHFESEPVMPTVHVAWAATATASAMFVLPGSGQ